MPPEMGQAMSNPTLDSSSDSPSDYSPYPSPESSPEYSPEYSPDSSSDSSDMSVQHSRRRNLAWGHGEAGPSRPRRQAVAQVEEEPIIEPATADEWENYEPPAALQWAPNTTNEMLIDILQTSVTNIRTSITERREREIREQEERECTEAERVEAERVEAERVEAERVEAERVEAERFEAERVEAERVEAERTSREEAKGKGKEPYLPVIVSARSGEDLLEEPLPYFAGNGEGPSTRGPAVLLVQPKKKSSFSLRNILRWRKEKDVPRSSGHSLRSGGSSSTTDIETPPDENTNTTASQPPVSQPPAVVENLPEPSTDECVSCFEDFSPQEMINVTCHSYCQECFDRLVGTATQNEQQWPPKCCLNVIPFRTVLRYASSDLQETYRNRSDEWSLPVADRVYCSQRNCNLWIRPSRIDRIQHLARCDADHQTCTICREPQHTGEECPRDPDVALTNELAKEEGWQRCAQCRAFVEHSDACEHMTCRCGYQFCYVCGETYKTCECTIEDLNALKERILARRELRQVREAEAESELRDALRQIAEAEERERREEEERLQALALRVRWERQRRHEIRVNFRRLRRRLEEVHDQQKGLVAYQHRRERYTSSQEASTSTEELATRQKAEMAEFNENKARNRVEWELWLQDDYNRRSQKDKKVEERYLRDLKDFANTRGRTESINDNMQVLRERLDRDARFFRQRQEEWLVRYRRKADEETTAKAELLASIVRWHEENLAEAKKEQERRQAAELRWVALVMDERARLMNEAENAELNALPETVASVFGVPVVVGEVAVS